MAEHVTYRVDLRLIGRITQIPDSQKLFGALIYNYAEHTSAEQATAFVAGIRQADHWFSVSNLLPSGYLPLPHSYLLSQLAESTTGHSQEVHKKTYKSIKKRLFVPAEGIRDLITNPEKSIYPYIHVQQTQQIHASIDSKRYNVPGLDPNLYSVPEIVIRKIGTSKDEENTAVQHFQMIKEFSFFIGLEKCPKHEVFVNTLESARDIGKTFILGPRGSQGMNTFQITGIHEEEYVESNQPGLYLNLGMLLPHKIDFEKSSIKLFTSERRPYNPLGGWDDSMKGKFISFIDSGSVVYVTEGIRNAGCSVTSPFQTDEIVFGNAFLYPLTALGSVAN